MSEILRGVRVDSHRDIVNFYTTKNGEKQRHSVAAKYIFASARDNLEAITRLKQELLQSLGLESKIEKSEYKYTLHVKGGSETEKELSVHWHKFFKESLNTSKPEMVTLRFPVYSLLEFDNSQPIVVGLARPQEILGRYCAIDIEKKAKGSDIYGEIAMCSLASPSKKELFVLEENAPEDLEGTQVYKVGSEQEVTTSISKALEPYNTVFIHNAPFDVSELRATKTKNSEKLLTGLDGIEPHIRGSGFVRRVWHPEIDFVDNCKFSQLLTPNASDTLDDLSKFWKEDLEKVLHDKELERLINNPSPENNRIVANYCGVDSEIALRNGEKEAEAVGPFAIYFGKALGNMVAVSKRTLALQRRSAEYWNILKTYRSSPALRFKKQIKRKGEIKEEWQDFSYSDEKMTLLNDNLKLEPRFGLIKNVIVFYPIITAPKGLAGISNLEQTLQAGDPKTRTIRAEFLDALCTEQLYNLQQNDKYFKWRYGITPEAERSNIYSKLKQLSDFLMNNYTSVINIGPRFLYLKRNNLSLEQFNLDKEFGIFYGIADRALSIGINKIAWRLDDVLFSEGIDIKGRYGLRSDFERETSRSLILDAFDYETEKARAVYKEKLLKLAKGDVSDRDLAYKVAKHKEHLSIQSEETLRQQIIRQLGLKLGETAYAVYCKDKRWHRLGENEPNKTYYLEKFVKTNPENAGEGTIGRFDAALGQIDLDLYKEVWSAAGYNCVVF
jgi:hypothetical protein